MEMSMPPVRILVLAGLLGAWSIQGANASTAAEVKATPSLSEPRSFTDPLLETMTLVSNINGKEYELRIGLPYTYHQSSKAYPVFLVLDGESFFLTAAEVARNEPASSMGPLSGGTGPIPEFIVVSIALPSNPPNPFRRNYEFMPQAKRDELAPHDESIHGQRDSHVRWEGRVRRCIHVSESS
jgi:hypothetical protein